MVKPEMLKEKRKYCIKIGNLCIIGFKVKAMHSWGFAKELIKKLDGVGPVYNTPYTDKVQNFVNKNVICDM